jgi:hypothetical protein
VLDIVHARVGGFPRGYGIGHVTSEGKTEFCFVGDGKERFARELRVDLDEVVSVLMDGGMALRASTALATAMKRSPSPGFKYRGAVGRQGTRVRLLFINPPDKIRDRPEVHPVRVLRLAVIRDTFRRIVHGHALTSEFKCAPFHVNHERALLRNE